jgi:hypothetical protein
VSRQDRLRLTEQITTDQSTGESHGQGTDAKQQGKEKTEGNTKHQKRWRFCVRCVQHEVKAGRQPIPQEGLAARHPG